MGLFDRKTKVKTQTVDFVQKRVEMSSLFSTYIEYLNDTEEHNKGDFEIYHWEYYLSIFPLVNYHMNYNALHICHLKEHIFYLSLNLKKDMFHQ